MESMGDESLYGPDKINVPVLGDHREVAVLAARHRRVLFAALRPTLELQWWEGVGHFLMMEKPKQFNER